MNPDQQTRKQQYLATHLETAPSEEPVTVCTPGQAPIHILPGTVELTSCRALASSRLKTLHKPGNPERTGGGGKQWVFAR